MKIIVKQEKNKKIFIELLKKISEDMVDLIYEHEDVKENVGIVFNEYSEEEIAIIKALGTIMEGDVIVGDLKSV